MKGGIRIAAITSGPAANGKSALVVCIIARSGVIEGAISAHVMTDGTDSTARITSMIRRSRFREQVKLIALNGIALAGLNVIDIKRVAKSLNADFAVLTRRRPRNTLLIRALKRLSKETGSDTAARIRMVEGMSGLKLIKSGGFFVQSSAELPESVVRLAFDALRVSHIVSRGISTGESKGRI